MVHSTTDPANRGNGDQRSDSSGIADGVTRRRTLRMGSLFGAGSVLGVAGLGTDSAAARDRPDEVVHLDYDDYDTWSDVYRRSNGDPDNLTLVSNPTHAGERALQLRLRENDHWGVITHYDFEGGLFELTGRVRFALNTGWSMAGRSEANCRLWNCAIGIGPGSAAGRETTGTNGWSNRVYVTSRETDPDGPFHLLSYTYHMDHDGWGDHDFLLEGEEYALDQPTIDPGRWYEFEYYVCVNTVSDGTANPDGIVRYWLDGEPIYEREDLRFTIDHDDNLIDSNGPAGYYGGQYTSPQNNFVYYDEHSMALNGRFEFESC